jgi:uncharacterized pyridoxamine 5'-phosphate oxidase family protein
MVFDNNLESLNILVFRENTSPLFKQIYQHDRDFELFCLLKQLGKMVLNKQKPQNKFTAKS